MRRPYAGKMKTTPSIPVAQAARCSLCLICLFFAAPLAAADPDFDYDIFLQDDTLMLWIDVTPVLTQSRMEDLLAGLDVFIEIDVEAERPRKLFFPKSLASKKSAAVISRHLARDTYRLRMTGTTADSRIFKNQLILSQFLADSLVVPVAAAEILQGKDIRLSVSLISKSYSNNLGAEAADIPEDSTDEGSTEDSEFFESLVSTFLDLVGFGTSSYRFTTPPFSVDDLPAF